MTRPLTDLLALLTCALLASAAGLLLALAVALEDGLVASAVRRYLRMLDADLRFLRLRWRAATLALLQAACSVLLLVATVASGLWLCLSPLPLVLLAPRHLLQRERGKRVSAIDEQVGMFLMALANALRATPAIGEALAVTARLLPAPFGQELALMLSEYGLGTPLDEALTAMAVRIDSKTVSSAVGTLRVARRTGGDLSQTLEVSAASLREIARLEGVLRAKTAEGKAQALLIAGLPIPFVGVLQFMSPELIEPLGQTATGHMIVGAAVALWLAAILLARRILAVEI